jgi:hypothetical protein
MSKKGRVRKLRQDRAAQVLAVPPPEADPFRSEAPEVRPDGVPSAVTERAESSGALEDERPSGSGDAAHAASPSSPPTAEADAPASEPPIPPDDLSVPPVSLDDWDSPFFSEGSPDEPDPRAARHALFASTAERRAHLSRYVIAAVAFSAAICLVALAKAALFRAGEGDSAPAAATLVGRASLDPLPIASRDVPPGSDMHTEITGSAGGEAPKAAEPAADPAPLDSPALAAPSASAGAAPSASVDPSSVIATSAAADAAVDPGEALRQREACRAALEQNKLGAAVGAGERAVALDPGDGEAWLVLGAAYQERGDLANARRCYRACLSEGKRGPRKECADMLR